MKYRFFVLLFLILALFYGHHVPGQMSDGDSDVSKMDGQNRRSFLVIVNSANDTSAISKNAVSRIFMKKMTRWEDGTAVLPVDQLERSPIRDEFSIAIHHKAASTIVNHWQKMIFSGRATPPLIVNSDLEVINYVKNSKGAIGYVSPSAPVDGVKVLKITE